MGGWPHHHLALAEQELAASLDDNDTGSHRAYLSSDDGTVSWVLNGRFVRSFRADSAGRLPPQAATSVDHIVFTRFKEEGASDTATYAIALCIFRYDELVIHYYSGEEFGVMLPFSVRAVHSLHTGILVQSKAAPGCADSGLFAAELPTFFSLLGPRSEFKMLGLNRSLDLDRMRGQRDSLFILSPAPATSDDFGDSIPVFNDASAVLVSTAVSRLDTTAQYVLCWDTSLRRHAVYQCIVSSRPLDNDGEYALDADTSFGALSGRAAGADRGHLSASRPGLNRQPSMSVQRRSSAAVSAAAMAAASRRKSSYSSSAKNSHRNSLLGRMSFNDSPGVNYAADMFREQRPARAEIILHLCWTERRQRGEPRASDAMSAQLFVIQSAAGNDVVCVFYRDIGQVVGLETSGFSEVFRHSARSVAPVRAIRPDIDDLLIVTDAGRVALAFGDGEEPVVLDTPCQGQISEIKLIEGALATLATVAEHDDDVVISTQVPVSRLVMSALDSLSFVLSAASCSQLRRCAIASVSQAKDGRAQLDRLAMLLVRGADRGDPAVSLGARAKKELRDRAAAALYALHLVYEDASMHKDESALQLYEFGRLLAQFAQQHGVSRAKQLYALAGFRPDGAVKAAHSRQRADCTIPSLPLFAQWALSLATADSTRVQPFPSLGSIAELFSPSACKPVRGAPDALKLLDAVADVLLQLRVNCNSPLVLQRLAADKAPSQLLLQLTPELRWLVGAIMEQTRKVCSPQWPPSVLALLGRHDLVANFGCGPVDTPVTPGNSRQELPQATDDQADSDEDGPAENRSIVELCEEALSLLARTRIGGGGSSSSSSGQSAESKEFSSVSFSRDLRVEEADQLLQLTATVHTNYQLSSAAATASIDSQESTEGAKALYMDQLARRTLALPAGRALFDYATRNANLQDALAIASPKVCARFRGHKADTVWAAGSVDTSWSLFHSGVAAALSIERGQAKSIHPSWILLNWPSELDVEAEAGGEDGQHKKYRDSLALHAGFLLGMGLLSGHDGPDNDGSRLGGAAPQQGAGPLCDIPSWQALRYLTTRDGLTSIALMLGLACAHRGTMSTSVRRVLSLHIPSLLPPRSPQRLLLSYGTQAAAMLGLGLLFMRSQNRRMVEVMLCELSSIRQNPLGNDGNFPDGSDPAESTAECCSLASGFALGLVVLGQGLSTQTLADLQLLDTLSEMMGSSSSSSSNAGSHGARLRETLALDAGHQGLTSGEGAISDLGLIAALGLAFLGTDYAPAAQRLALPAVVQQLRTADPFVLLWKSLMRSLIMLNSVRPAREWVEASMPLALAAMPGPVPADLCRVRLNIVSAACFALALKYAGTEDRAAHSTILAYFAELEAIATKPMLGYEQNLTRACAQSCLDILCVSVALVMAGSGDVSTMARLRALHGVSASRSYGNHMASHMALGILFIGGGARFTISRSYESIAMLVVALFPRFPQHYTDNGEHLQAWRHIWALCIEPRCLVVRDAITNKICRNVTVTVARSGPAGARETETIVPPVPLQQLASAASVKLQALGYLPLELDFSRPVVAGQQLSARRVLYMQPTGSILLSGVAGARDYPIMFEQYREWLLSSQRLIVEVAERLSATHVEAVPGVPDAASIAATIHAIARIRVCVQFSRYISALRTTGAATPGAIDAAECWAETTYAVWMSAREKVLALARQSASRSMLSAYWTGSQVPSSSPAGLELSYAVVGLLSTALDLPSPAHAMELAKHVPVYSLVDYVLG